MDPLRIAFIVGTRPEAIKLAPLYREMRQRAEIFSPRLWATGQHRQMLDQAFQTFGLTPDRDFDVMRPDQSLTEVTCAILREMQGAFQEEKPAMILVQGDTTTVFAASLAAFYAGIPIGHVEAGLRTWNKQSPFPEEINRQLTSRLSDLHFAPTDRARDNLLHEGIPESCIRVTGNTVIDALDMIVDRVRKTPPLMPADFPMDRLMAARRMILITGHRRENFGAGFEAICYAIRDLAQQHPECEFVYPVHLNPRVQEPVRRILSDCSTVHLTAPLAYEQFVWAMDRAFLVLSDSGGVQEEAPHLGKPVLVLRDTTERPEAIAAGTCKLVGVDREKIVSETSLLLTDTAVYDQMARATNPFGDGRASIRIADAIQDFFIV